MLFYSSLSLFLFFFPFSSLLCLFTFRLTIRYNNILVEKRHSIFGKELLGHFGLVIVIVAKRKILFPLYYSWYCHHNPESPESLKCFERRTPQRIDKGARFFASRNPEIFTSRDRPLKPSMRTKRLVPLSLLVARRHLPVRHMNYSCGGSASLYLHIIQRALTSKKWQTSRTWTRNCWDISSVREWCLTFSFTQLQIEHVCSVRSYRQNSEADYCCG